MINPETVSQAPLTARYQNEAIDQVLRCVEDGVYCALLGPRLCGKTVLMRYVEQLLRDMGWSVAYLDLLPLGAPTLGGFFNELVRLISDRVLEQTGRALPASDGNLTSSAMFRGYLTDGVTTLGHDLVLIIEHIEALPTDLVQALLTSLRAAYMDQQTQEYRVTVILSGALSLATLTVGESSPFRGIARRVFVGDLSAEESRSMIGDFLQEYGVQYTSFAQERLLEAASGDTFLIRKLSQQCAEQLQVKSLPQLGARNVHQVIKHFLEEDVYQYAPLLEAVRLIEEDPDLMRCIILLLENESVRKAELPLPLSPDLDPLYLTGVVESVFGDSYRLQNTIYRQFLTDYFNPSRVGNLLAMAGRWDAAIDYLEASYHQSESGVPTDLLPATINSMYAAEEPVQAAHFLTRALWTVFGVRQAQIWYAPSQENHLRLIRQLGEIPIEEAWPGTEMSTSEDSLEARAFRQTISLRGGESSPYIRRAIPLAVPGEKPIGVVTLWETLTDRRVVEQRQRDLQLLSYLTQAARALMVVQARRQELALAGRMQASLLPNDTPHLEGWEFSATWKPAREASGDFYDFIPLPNGRLGIVIADVVDKGMGAALYMALGRTLIRTFATGHPDQAEQVLRDVNARLLEDAGSVNFVTVFYGILDPIHGVLTYCNAGHNPPYALVPNWDSIQNNGGVKEEKSRSNVAYTLWGLKRTSMALGVAESKIWEQHKVVLAPGSLLVLYTDGLVDAINRQGEAFGDQRLLELARENVTSDAEQVSEAILSGLAAFTGDAPQYDDITMVVVKRDD